MSFSFGAQTNTAAKTPSFNFGPAASSGGLSFGSGSTNPPTATVQPLSAPAFGLSSTTSATTGVVAPTLSFGQPSLGSTAQKPAPLSFSSTTQPSLNFGAPAAQPANALSTGTSLSFGANTSSISSSQVAPGTSFGLSTSGTQNKIAPTFGAATGQTLGSSQPSLLGGIGTASTAATGSFNLGTTPAQTSNVALGLGGSIAPTATTTVATASVGLGGTAIGGISATSSSSDPKTGGKAIKETAIPNELVTAVEDFKKFVKEERGVSSDIAHVSPKIHDKISEEVDGLSRLVTTLMSGLSRNRLVLDKLKKEAAQELINAEIAQRTKDTPPGLQYENVAPFEYFERLMNNFENQMLHYRRQIEETEQHLQTMASGRILAPEDVTRALQKLHTAFIGLAGRYHEIHETVKMQAETYVQWHRQRFGSTIELYESKGPVRKSTNSGHRALLGPSPFTGDLDLFAQAKAAALAAQAQQPQQNSMIGGQTLLAGPPTSRLGGTSSLAFPATPAGPTSNQSFLGTGASTPGLLGSSMSPFGATLGNNQSSLFQTGGKRGKH